MAGWKHTLRPAAWCFCALSVLAGLSVRADNALDPAWIVPRQRQRVVFDAPAAGRRCVVVELARQEDDKAPPAPDSVAAYSAAGQRLPHRIVHASEQSLWVLVRTDFRPDERRTCAVYFDGVEPTEPLPSGHECHDDAPVFTQIFKPQGPSVPDTWERLQYLYQRARPRGSPRYSPDFNEMPDLPTQRGGENQGYPLGWLAQVKSVVQCPVAGLYRFALDCRDSGFLFVDGEPAAEWPGEHEPGRWRAGAPVALPAGPHKLELFCFAGGKLEIKLGWQTPDSTQITQLPPSALIASAWVDELRLERIDRSLNPDCAYELLPSYRVRGSAEVFIPVRLVNRTRNRLGEAMITRWSFDDGRQTQGNEVRHILRGRRKHRVTMEVRDAAGFAAVQERVLDCRFSQPIEFAFDAALEGLPAVAYAGDKVQPRLSLLGDTPAEAAFDLTWQIERDGDQPLQGAATFRLEGTAPVKLPLADLKIEEMARLQWSVQHEGTELLAGLARVLRPPFEVLPAVVTGDRLYDKSGKIQLTLLPYRSAGQFRQAGITTEQAFGSLLCVDDFVFPEATLSGEHMTSFHDVLARIVDGPDRPWVRHFVLPAWEQSPQAYGALLKLVQVQEALWRDTDVVILSVGLLDLLARQKPDLFERQAAALSDLLTVTLGRAVVWVTPPPYSGYQDRVRPFAVAIQRVADARHIPVADLFTAFRGIKERRYLAREGGIALSQNGQNMAAQLIAWALLEAQE